MINKYRPALTRLKEGLTEHYSAPLYVTFRQFRAGVIYFAVGLGAILMAHVYIEPSLAQELITLGGLILGGLGYLIAMAAEMRLLIGRIVMFFRS